jgi:hypothetical protein
VTQTDDHQTAIAAPSEMLKKMKEDLEKVPHTGRKETPVCPHGLISKSMGIQI